VDDRSRMPPSGPRDDLFKGLAHTPQQHFTLYFYAALLRLLHHASVHFESPEAMNARLPFLAGYFDEIRALGIDDASFDVVHARWRCAMATWERMAPGRLPLAALARAAGLDHHDLTLLVQIGLPDEDPRLGLAFDAMQGDIGARRPTLALLAAGWPNDATTDPRDAVRRLQAIGLVEPVGDDSGAYRPCAAAWDAMRGSTLGAGRTWARYRPPYTLPELGTLVLPPAVRAQCEAVPDLLVSGGAAVVVVRGPRHNGRATTAAAIARRMGKGVLEVCSLEGAHDPRWRSAASLACLLDAAILTAADLAPSESFELPELPDDLAPLFLTVGRAGGIDGFVADRAVTLRLETPSREARGRLWSTVLGAGAPALAARRMTSGNIVRAANLARGTSALAARRLDDAALRDAVRALERSGLEPLAKRVETSEDWSQLAVSCETRTELGALEARCRHRERLGEFVGEALSGLGPGVRVLFRGSSGTGKTLAARVLAGAVGMDLYRVDLSSVVNKYVGETEKNLERVFARAEELDVILLLDEGDALLTARTSVQSSNDRYANLETNFLLQRFESYEGVVIVTTNAGERIDGAFQRRMDVVIDFTLPDAAERWAIWQMHLPAEHEVEMELLQAVVQRCAFSGGQIRNASLHAALLALEADSRLVSAHLETAIEREYRKLGAISPLRARFGAR
jgi:hypothetical protein